MPSIGKVFNIGGVPRGERLGELYRRARGDRTQAWVAGKLLDLGFKIDQTGVSDAERGVREIDMREVAAFAKVLGLSRTDISRALNAEYEEAASAL